MASSNDRDFTFEIVDHIGTISRGKNGWNKELNLIRWNNQNSPKFDIRAWPEDHEHMGRGVTLYADEIRELSAVYMKWKNRRTVEEAKREEQRRNDSYRRQREEIQNRSGAVVDFSEDEAKSTGMAESREKMEDAQAAPAAAAASVAEAVAENSALESAGAEDAALENADAGSGSASENKPESTEEDSTGAIPYASLADSGAADSLVAEEVPF